MVTSPDKWKNSRSRIGGKLYFLFLLATFDPNTPLKGAFHLPILGESATTILNGNIVAIVGLKEGRKTIYSSLYTSGEKELVQLKGN